jgi:hypothetical protein
MIKRRSANGVTKSGLPRPQPLTDHLPDDPLKRPSTKPRPQPITTVTTVDRALAGKMYDGLRRANVVSVLAALNIPFPAELPDITEATQVPIKIGDVEDRTLGDLQSFWGAQFARCNALLSITRAEAKRLDRIVKRQEKIIFRQYAPSNPRSTLVDAVWGNVYAHSSLAKLEKKLDSAIALEETLEGLTKDFQIYLDIIRSELMWRMSERRATREN